MADDKKVSGKIGVDTTDFKTGIQGMNRELRVLESGFRASAASLGDWASDATGLESRIKTLSSSMEIQQRKVQATREEYERIKTEKGENSRAAQDLEIKLNKETETLGKMGVELQTTEEALQELQSGSDDAGNSVDDLGNTSVETGGKMEGFKTVLGGVGAVVTATIGLVIGLVAAIAAVAGAIGGLVFSTATASADLVDLSLKTGISTTRLQEMEFISKQVGTSLDTITGAQARLIRSMSGASDETEKFNQKVDEANQDPWDSLKEGDVILGDMAKAFETLGVSVMDSGGNLRDSQTVFAETLDALGKIENAAERDALTMSIFGKSAQELNPLIKTGSAEMAKLAEKAHEVGAVMSEEDVAAFEAFDDTLASLQAGLKGTLGTLASTFLPGFQAVFNQVGGYLKTFTDIVNGADGDFGKIAEGLTGLVTQIATDVAAQAPQMLQAGLAIVKSILDAIIEALPAMLEAAVNILTSLIDFIIEGLPTLLDAGIKIILFLVDAIIQNLPKLIDAALQAIITLADGLTLALPTLVPAMVEAILTIVLAILDNLPMIVDAALALILALADGLVAAIPILADDTVGSRIMPALLDALLQIVPALFIAGAQLLIALAGGLVASIKPEILKFGSAFLEEMLFQKVMWVIRAVQMGKDFIKGLIDGIKAAASDLYDAISNVVGTMLGTVDTGLESQSPSRAMRRRGVNAIQGFGLGVQDEFKQMERQLALSFRGLASVPAFAGSPAGGNGNTVNSEYYTFLAPVTIGAGAGSLGETVKAKRFS